MENKSDSLSGKKIWRLDELRRAHARAWSIDSRGKKRHAGDVRFPERGAPMRARDSPGEVIFADNRDAEKCSSLLCGRPMRRPVPGNAILTNMLFTSCYTLIFDLESFLT